MTDDEMTTIEAEVVEVAETLPAVREPGTLFRTDNPYDVVAKATDTANALMEAIRNHDADKPPNKKLISSISGREFPKVECWTLLGSMLGVFPVLVWTREVENGWEARVEAKTLGGSVVGAAEAECLRTESNWKNRDGYALRSMAQTRATSKALRQPLGFVMVLAGLESTPAEEMPSERPQEASGAPETVREDSRPYPVPKSWPKILDAAKACDNPDESEALYEAHLKAATYHLYGKTSLKEISTDERKVVAQKAAGAVVWLHETDAGRDGPFSYFGEAEWRQAWASVLDGHVLAIPDYVPPEPPIPDAAQEEVERIAAEVFSDE